MSPLSHPKTSHPGPQGVQSPPPREQGAPLPAGISMCYGLGRNFKSVPRWDRTGKAGGQRDQERSREQAGGGSVFCLLLGGAKWEGGRGLIHTLTHTQCLSWQEEEMPCIFQPLVPRPSLNASPKNTAWKQSYANSPLLSLSPSSPPLHRFIFEWGRCVKVTWCWQTWALCFHVSFHSRFWRGREGKEGSMTAFGLGGKQRGWDREGHIQALSARFCKIQWLDWQLNLSSWPAMLGTVWGTRIKYTISALKALAVSMKHGPKQGKEKHTTQG